MSLSRFDSLEGDVVGPFFTCDRYGDDVACCDELAFWALLWVLVWLSTSAVVGTVLK